MASISLFLDKRNRKSDKFPLKLRISHQTIRKDIPTGYKLADSEWNDHKKKIKSSYENSTNANFRLKEKLAVASKVIMKYEPVLANLSVYDLGELVKKAIDEVGKEKIPPELVDNKPAKTTLKAYGKIVTERYEKAKRFGMVKSFKDAIEMILRFHGSNKLLLSDIDETFLEDLEADYVGSGKKINGLGVRLRAIRRIYNLAIKDKNTEVTMDNYPFGRGGYSIKAEKSKKRAVKLDVVKAIRDLNYKEGSSLWHHRNYFLFMFNMRGMNFIDLAYLAKAAISKGRIKYKRRKTKRGQSVKEFNIKLTKEARNILFYYIKGKAKHELIFPILEDVIDSDNERQIYNVYQNRLCNHNRRLITIGDEVGLKEHLTTYVARHTFATAGLHKGVSKARLGDMLGHTSYYTTEAYFDEFDKEVLDKAAEQILG